MNTLNTSYPIYFERKKQIYVLLIISIIVSGIITYYSFKLYTIHHIFSSSIFIILLFYLSWLYFNPFCKIEPDHFEISRGLFSRTKYFFRDIEKAETDDEFKKIILIFNDYDNEEIPLNLLSNQHKEIFVKTIQWHVYKDLSERE